MNLIELYHQDRIIRFDFGSCQSPSIEKIEPFENKGGAAPLGIVTFSWASAQNVVTGIDLN